MANSTTTVNLPDNTWTEVLIAGANAVVTPETPKGTFLVRYAAVAPLVGVTDGHIFKRSATNPNLVIGSANTDKAFMRPVNIGSAVDAHVTIL